MAVSEKFRNAVAVGDVAAIRLSMSNALILDTTFRDFAEMEKLAANAPNLYMPYNQDPMETDRNRWDDDYLGLQQVKLESNFCPERIKHVKAVVLKLHPPKTLNNSQERAGTDSLTTHRSSGFSGHSGTSYKEQKRMDAQNGRIIKVVGCGVGGAILGVVAGSTTGGVIGALLGCGVGYVISTR